MGWDDSDEEEEWDADDIEAKVEALRKEKERERRREEGLDSDSDGEKAAKKAAAASAVKVKKEKGPSTKQEEKKPDTDPDQVQLDDPKAERARLKRLQEAQNARLAGDLFAGFEKDETPMEKEKREKTEAAQAKVVAKPKVKIIDSFKNLDLKVQKDVDDLSSVILGKFEKSTLHKGGPVKFITELFKQLESSLDLQDLEDLNKTVDAMVKDKKVVKGATQSKDNKANTKINKNTKFNTTSEWADVYGGGGDEYEEEWTTEEWEAWEKEKVAKAKK